MRLFSTIAVLLIMILQAGTAGGQAVKPGFLNYIDHQWVDSVFKTMSTDEQIAQCIWVAAWSDRDVSHSFEIADLITEYKIGGLIFFQGTPEKQAELSNHYQSLSEIPLIIAMDAEWGLGMRLTGVDRFPYQMTLGAIRNDSLIYLMGRSIALQARRTGVHVNFAPVADINNNPSNPVINYRSFGEQRENVASKSVMYMKGLQDNGILATAKHFPGHGDTDTDSHYDLPVLKHSRQRFDSLEFYPFRRLIDEGAGAIMTAHLNVPALDIRQGLPSTLSDIIITGLLKKEMNFSGLVVTDAMNMRGVTGAFPSGTAEAKAFEAGNDVLEFVTDVGAAISEIRKLIESGRMSAAELEARCRKVLALKYWAGLADFSPVATVGLSDELASGELKAQIRELYENAITVLENRNNVLPVRNLESTRIATLAVNRKAVSIYQETLGRYTSVDHYFVDMNGGDGYREVLETLRDYDLVIAGIFGTDQRPGSGFGISAGLDSLIKKLNRQNRVIVTYFGNPYAIARIPSLQEAAGVILTYQENDFTESLAAQLVFGAFGSRGTLPVTINPGYPAGYGIRIPGNIRLQYGYPESAGMSSLLLNHKIDSLANLGISEGAYPGCVVMAARKGIVVFNKTYGHHEYDGRIEVREDDLYDLASVTKIAASTPALMLLDARELFSPDETLGHYVPLFKGSDKQDLKLREMLAHQAGLVAWIPFWKETIKEATGEFRSRTFQPGPSDRFPVMVANNLYIHRTYRNRLFREIRDSKLGEKKFLYSDLTFIIVPEIISSITGEDWTGFVTENIYRKLGAHNLTFNPYLKYPLTRIVPTEYDSLFRRQLLHGTVHDEGAAMLGGASGHAGLFGTAGDLMKLMEMYRRQGSYGDEQLIPREIIAEYTTCQFPENKNRRGLGFDKPLLNNDELPDEEVYPIRETSLSSFGHSGFTGTFTWVDPEYELTYVFLSNRVYPTRDNPKLSELGIRTGILKALYDSITD
ncbi:MAG: glycoside hydrolase family 3 N-terminal domain-containing protein [Bacteroidales bacterium]|jgi:beta-glucosidase-like glycosyl hydrolase/CubicO group peptidase (beta-lactamase class C family)|nr:glycoside hydrolase family 3 N-terminal domain-containing protein [Bacteroidales bacterium]